MTEMKAVQVPHAGGEFQEVSLTVPDPRPEEVRVRVEACGVCHSDAFIKEGAWPGVDYPRVPGHEVAGVVDEVGSEVQDLEPGERVGLGWHGGHCFRCDACRDGDFINCDEGVVTGADFDGGYAEFVVARPEALARIPDALDPRHAAPLLCAGITSFNALRNSGATGGDLVAVQGIGGLGHLAVQFSSRMGFETVAISSSPEKEELALELGAHGFISSSDQDPAEVLSLEGGADVILATAPDSRSISELVDGLGRDGVMMTVAGTDLPLEVAPLELIQGRKTIQGWPSGDARDSEDTLRFSVLEDVRPRIEAFALGDAARAYEAMLEGEVRFRSVLEVA